MSRVQEFEDNVDVTLEIFMNKLREQFARTGKPCEMTD